jgi:hypothetical protein
MTNLVNPYRFAVAGNQLPAGAIAYANFLTSYFYAGGAETTAAAMFDLFKPARHEASGYLVDFNIDYDGLSAKGAFLSDLATEAPNGLTLIMEIETQFRPAVEMLTVFEGATMDAPENQVYWTAESGAGADGEGSHSHFGPDSIAPKTITGPDFEFVGSPTVPGNYINRIGGVAGRDEGGGNYGVWMSINGNSAFGSADTGIGGANFIVEGSHYGAIPEWYVALGPDGYIREIILYPSKTDAELEALSTL